jgi:hypothetical protein
MQAGYPCSLCFICTSGQTSCIYIKLLKIWKVQVDEMVTTFSELNRGMEQTGTFTMTRKSLFQLVAAANTTLADVILRLGLLER